MAVALDPPALRTPGLKPVDPAWESYWVRPGGATVIAVRPDDRVTVVDLDGGQPAELTVLDASGRDDGAALGTVADAPATVLRGLLANGAGDGFLSALHARGLRPEDARARAALRPGLAAALQPGLPRRPRGDGGRRRAGRPDRRRRGARLDAHRGGPPRGARRPRGGRAAGAAGRAAARLPRRQGVRARLRGPRRRVHPDHRRARAPVLGLPRLPLAQARARRGARARPAGHAHADGHGLPDRRPALEVLRRRHGPAVRGGAGHRRAPRLLRPGLHGPLLRGPGLSRPRQLHGELQPAARPVRDPVAQGLGGAELLLQHVVRPRPRAPVGRAVVAPGRLRAAAGDERPRVRLLRLPRRHRPGQRLGDHRRPRPRLRPGEPLLDGHRPPRHPGGRARDDPGDGLPPAHRGPHAQPDGVPRLLAADLLHQRRRRRRVLGVPREGGGDGPLPPAQVGDPRPGRGGARPARDHARRAPALRRPGRLHGRLQRDRRHDRRRHGVPARAGQLPLRGRRRVRRRAPQGAGRPARAARVGQAVDRPAAQPRRPGAAQPRDPGRHRVDAGHPAGARRAQVVPLPDRADRRPPGAARGDLPHGLHGASWATRCSATRATGRRCGTRSWPRARRTG